MNWLRRPFWNYTAGLANYLHVLSADNQYQQARLGFVQAQALRLLDTSALFVALGGGWWKGARTGFTTVSHDPRGTPLNHEKIRRWGAGRKRSVAHQVFSKSWETLDSILISCTSCFGYEYFFPSPSKPAFSRSSGVIAI